MALALAWANGRVIRGSRFQGRLGEAGGRPVGLVTPFGCLRLLLGLLPRFRCPVPALCRTEPLWWDRKNNPAAPPEQQRPQLPAWPPQPGSNQTKPNQTRLETETQPPHSARAPTRPPAGLPFPTCASDPTNAGPGRPTSSCTAPRFLFLFAAHTCSLSRLQVSAWPAALVVARAKSRWVRLAGGEAVTSVD